MQESLKSLIYLNKKERRGLLALIILLCLLMTCKLVLIYFPSPGPKHIFDPIAWDSLLIEKQPNISKSKQKTYDYPSSRTFTKKKFKPKTNLENRPKLLFAFDPNTISKDSLQLLPINHFAIKNLLKYRESGGRVMDKEGFKKIYSLSPEEFNKLESFLRFPEQEVKKTVKSKPFNLKVNLNSSSETELQVLPGIGPVISKRIIKFREGLGGFHSKTQLAEVFGLADSTYQSIVKHVEVEGEIKKININNATVEEMSKHPYINYKTAQIIQKYRKQHGSFGSAEELLKIKLISKEFIERVTFYLSFDD